MRTQLRELFDQMLVVEGAPAISKTVATESLRGVGWTMIAHSANGAATGCTAKLEVSEDGENWTEEAFGAVSITATTFPSAVAMISFSNSDMLEGYPLARARVSVTGTDGHVLVSSRINFFKMSAT